MKPFCFLFFSDFIYLISRKVGTGKGETQNFLHRIFTWLAKWTPDRKLRSSGRCRPHITPVSTHTEQIQYMYTVFGGTNTAKTDQRELIILQSNSSQHMRRLAWWSARTDGGTRMGSTSQFSSDSYKARMKSPESCRSDRHYVSKKKLVK